jgi:hypothetical protein
MLRRGIFRDEADAMKESVADDTAEILAVSDDLSRRGLYGAAQMVCRLARERDEARAAIAAMREPTPMMFAAANGDGWTESHSRQIWQLMIDEALK